MTETQAPDIGHPVNERVTKHSIAKISRVNKSGITAERNDLRGGVFLKMLGIERLKMQFLARAKPIRKSRPVGRKNCNRTAGSTRILAKTKIGVRLVQMLKDLETHRSITPLRRFRRKVPDPASNLGVPVSRICFFYTAY